MASDQAFNRTDSSVPVTVVGSDPIHSSDVPALIDGHVSTTTSSLTVSLHLQSIRDEVGDWSVNGVTVWDRLGVVHTIPNDDLATVTGRSWTTG
jgi:hypothetical protein